MKKESRYSAQNEIEMENLNMAPKWANIFSEHMEELRFSPWDQR